MDSMNLYKRGSVWWCRFRDHKRVERRMRCAKSRRTAEAFARSLADLVDVVSSGQSIPDNLADWIIHGLDDERRKRLMAWGLAAPARLRAGDPLDQQVKAWRDGLRNRGRPEKYYELRYTRAHELLCKACGFALFRDIDPEAVQGVLAEWRRDGKRADYTVAHYLSAGKAFCRWMFLSRRSTFDPLAILSVSRGKPRKVRRALSDAEQVALIVGTEKLATRHRMTGPERALLYRLALSTGLRADAIRRLSASDVDLEAKVVYAIGSGASNKTSSAKAIPGHLAEALRSYVALRMPFAVLFDMPDEHQLAIMLREDMAELEIATHDTDFHSLRVTFASTMTARGVQPRTLMTLMDHKTIQMTMRYYARTFPQDEAAAVELIADPMAKKQKKETA